MRSRLLVLAVLALVLVLPFALRPKRGAKEGRADVQLVIITPHNEAIRFEFAHGFADWYRARTGKSIFVDWRVIGGTSEIARFLEGEYVTAFQLHWTRLLGREWSLDVQAGFQNPRLPNDAPAVVREARAAFLASDVSCGIDLFFGGGTYDFDRQARAGRLVDSGMQRLHPEWFNEDVIPRAFSGEEYWEPNGLWIGSVLSSYGLISNRDSLRRLGIDRPLAQWTELRDPRLVGEVALSDPTKSGSIAKVFENVLQQQMQRRLVALQKAADPDSDPATLEYRAVREGWNEGMKLLQLAGANSRYFTDTSQKPPIDVAQGDSAVGLCIDFYGRQQAEAVQRRGASDRLKYVAPAGGSVSSVDPIGLLRGAPNRDVAIAFIEYVLSMEGQKLWNLKPGSPGGPRRFALRRLPVRRDFYADASLKPYLSDPDASPFEEPDRLVYRPQWTSGLFREMGFAIKVMCIDSHAELTRAWRAIIEAGMPREALAELQNLSLLSYDETGGRIKRTLAAKDKVEELQLARELGEAFRAQYRRAEALAKAAGNQPRAESQ